MIRFLLIVWCLSLGLTLYGQSLSSELSVISIDENSIAQDLPIPLQNQSNEQIDFDWEVEYLNNSQAFLTISVTDINADYNPQVLTSCGLASVTNVILPSESKTIRLHLILDEIPPNFDRGLTLAQLNLYESDHCDSNNLISLPILFSVVTNTAEIYTNNTINLYPNPVDNLLHIENVEDYIGIPYEIYHMDGRLISRDMISNNPINVSNLRTGTYLLKVSETTKKFYK